MGKLIDLTGQKFGKLTVLGRAEDYVSPNTGKRTTVWLCKCDCGNPEIKKIMGGRLKNGQSKSCGCLQKEVASKTLSKATKKYNNYNLSGEYGIGYTTNGEEFYFDLADYEKIKDYCCSKDINGYIVTNISYGRREYLHRFLLNPDKNMLIDHINHNKLDDRKENLRIVNSNQNNENRSISRNNTSGVTGVSWSSNRNKWVAQIKINNKSIFLGRFDNFEDAVAARKEAEEKYFGEYSYDNSMKHCKVVY